MRISDSAECYAGLTSSGNRNILFKHNILCKVGYYGRASGSFAPWQATEGRATDLSITYRRSSFREMTLRFLMPTQVKLAIACCFSLVALISCTRETEQLPSFPTFARANGVTFFKFFFQTVWKRYARNFPMKVTPPIVTASRYFRIWFRVNDVHFVSGNWTELFYFNLD